jgi:integrase
LYRKNRRAQGAKDGTLNNEIGLLSTMFHMAVKDRKIPADFMPTEFVRKFSQPPRRRVEEEEYQALLEHADDDFRDVLICGYESAMRNSEIRNLTKRKVNLNVPHISGELLDYIYLGIFETKNETERVVPVSAELKEVLERRIKRLSNDDLVFTHNSRPYSRSMVSYFMQTTCERAKVPYGDNDLNADCKRVGIVFHSLRHTRTSLWVEEGSSDEIIRRATGHLSLAAFHRYVSQIDAKSIMRLVKTDQHSTNKNLTKTA